MRKIEKIIVHCTATGAGNHFTVSDIRRWHLMRGFRDIGYHFIVYLDGSVHAGRPIEDIGAHCSGHNAHSIGVAYVGGLDANGRPADTRTEAQRSALLRLIQDLKLKYPHATVHGHREFAAKACPCFDAAKEYSSL